MSAERSLAGLLATLTAGLVALCVWVAWGEWFVGDDFHLLARARRLEWGWLDQLLPTAGRSWPFYRPLGTDVYYLACNAVFGLEARGYAVVSLGVHLLGGLVLVRVARQLGFERGVALLVGFLGVSRAPTLSQLLANTFHYQLAILGGLLCLSLQLDHLRGGGVRTRAGSCLALAIALLSNEAAAVLPAVLVWLALCEAGPSRSWRWPLRALSSVLPQLVVLGAWAVLRFRVVAPAPVNAYATPALGWHVPRNLVNNAQLVFGGDAGWIFALALAAGCVALVALGGGGAGGRPPSQRWLARSLPFPLGWALLAGLPFAFLSLEAPQARFASVLEAPMALLLGAFLNAVWRVHAERHGRALVAALLAIAVASVPLHVLRARIEVPRGAQARRLLDGMAAMTSAMPPKTQVYFFYGLPGLATRREANLIRISLYGMASLRAYFPEKDVVTHFHDVGRDGYPPPCSPCLAFGLQADGSVDPFEPGAMRRR